MSRSRVFEWHKRFVSGHMEVEDDPRSGVTFFDKKGLFHHEFVPEGQTVNQHFYKQVLSRLHEWVWRERPPYGETIPGCFTMIVHPHTLRSL